MILRPVMFRRAAFALGSCALCCATLTVHAQTAAPDAKPAEIKPADAPADTTPYTLRLKFKQGDVNKYKTTMKANMTTPGEGGKPKTTDINITAVSEKKITKLLDGGGAEIVTTTKTVKAEADGKETPSPDTAPVTVQVDGLGKIVSAKGAGEGFQEMMQGLLSNSLSNLQSFLPDAAVKVGDKWTQKLSLPAPFTSITGTIDCSFTRVETVDGIKTALIHTVLKAPIAMMLDATQQFTKLDGEAMLILNGTVLTNSDINFAIDEGKIVRTLSDTNTDVALKLGKSAPPELSSVLPEGSKFAIKSNTDTKLLAPGETVETPKPAAPEKK